MIKYIIMLILIFGVSVLAINFFVKIVTKNRILKKEEYSKLHEAIDELRPREKEILSLRFGLNGYEELTQKETAERLGISQSYISRLEKRIIKKLKNNLKENLKV